MAVIIAVASTATAGAKYMALETITPLSDDYFVSLPAIAS
jgi:hypothetical protein